MCSKQPTIITGNQRIDINLEDITYIYVSGHGGEAGGADLADGPHP